MVRQSIFKDCVFWGIVLTAIAAMLPRLGFDMDKGSAADIINQLFTLIGTNMTLYGTATKGQTDVE